MRVSDLPFNKHIGIEDHNGAVTIPVKELHMNHLGTVHATAIYGVAEAGSGQFIIDNFGGEFPDAVAVTHVGTVKYKSAAKDDIFAEVTNSQPDPRQALDRLRQKGAAKIAVEVSVYSGNETVATATFDWFMRNG
ncbi:MAG: YiiD C-terminal domain-containing protein [Phycisphaerales bacterium]|nr:MAG: YiiD C-terminal domain-containing protein [Phycisphaerales bacterium]